MSRLNLGALGIVKVLEVDLAAAVKFVTQKRIVFNLVNS